MEERRLFEEPVYAGADLGGRGFFFPRGFDSPADPKGPPLFCFEISEPIFEISDYFEITDPTNLLREPWAQIYTDFEGGARAQ